MSWCAARAPHVGCCDLAPGGSADEHGRLLGADCAGSGSLPRAGPGPAGAGAGAGEGAGEGEEAHDVFDHVVRPS